MTNVFLTGIIVGDVKNNGGTGAFTIMCVDKWRDKNGQANKTTSYFDLIWFGKGEWCTKYLSEKTKIAVKGTLYQDKGEYNGKKYSKVKIKVETIDFLGKQNV